MTAAQDNGTETVPLAEAASRLGISEELVRKRIYRGKLSGEKIDGRWHVVMPHQDTVQDSGQDASGQVHDNQDSFAVALIEHQSHEIDFLRTELASRNDEMAKQREQWAEESRRKDIIIHELTSQLKALPEAIVEVQAEQQKPPPEEPMPAPKRLWWRFWETP
jgi:hypothetical protein